MDMTPEADAVGSEPRMESAYRELATPSMFALVALVIGALVVIFTFLGPFDTRQTLGLPQRFAYCALVGVLSLLVCFPAGVFTFYLMRFRSRRQIGVALCFYCLIMAAPGLAIAYGAYLLFHAGGRPSDRILISYLVSFTNLAVGTSLSYYVLYLRVSRNSLRDAMAAAAGTPRAVAANTPARATARSADGTGQHSGPHGNENPASSAATVVERIHDGETAAGGAAADEAATVSTKPVASPASIQNRTRPHRPTQKQRGPRLLDRIPGELGRDLIYLKVSGHYLEVVTTRGSAVILQRLADAIGELGDMGIQTHRSYWVAREHIRYWVRRDRRALLHLTGDHEVPVSRSLLPHVRRVVDTARRKGHPTDPQRSSPHPVPYAAGIVGQADRRPVPLGDGGPDGSETGERD